MDIHGRDPAKFPPILDRHRAVFREHEFSYEMASDGAWRISISPAGWARVMDCEPEIGKAMSFFGDLHGHR